MIDIGVMPGRSAAFVLGFLMLLAPACGGSKLMPTGAGGSSGVSWAICSLPFEAGTCEAYIPVYASVAGVCVPRIYGGCGGNANRFSTLEECLATCEGRPIPNGCPAGRFPKLICVACGPAGGCPKLATYCALPCEADAAAGACGSPASNLTCYEGFCQAAYCE